MDKSLSVNEILADAWQLAKKNIVILLGFTAVQFAFILIVTTVLTSLLGGASGAGVLIPNIILSLFDAFFTVAFYQVFFKLIDEDSDPEFPDFIPNLVKAVNFLIVKLIIGLVLVFIIAIISSVYFYNKQDIDTSNPFSWDLIPVFALIAIPLIFLTIRLCFVVCFIVDQESGASEAISQSWAITKGHFWFMALLFTVPFSTLILITAYRHLVNNYTEEEEILLNDPEN
jgi:hypothetical protein